MEPPDFNHGEGVSKRRVESVHDEIVFTLGKEANFDRGCTCTPKNDKNKFWGR